MSVELFECTYCKTTYVREFAFRNHICKQMTREDQMRTPQGQFAWSVYQQHNQVLHRSTPDITTFMASRTFSKFYKFAVFAHSVRLPDVNLFIRLMVTRGVDPAVWSRDAAYSYYVEYLDRISDPMTQAKLTIDTLFQIQKAAECEMSDVFDQMSGPDLIALMRQRRVSPWFLFWCPRFKKRVNRLEPHERQVIYSLLKPGYWIFQFGKASNQPAIEAIKIFVKELSL